VKTLTEENKKRSEKGSMQTHNFLRFYENRVKKDRESVFFIFLTALSKDTDDPRNIFMKGKSGIGKTYITVNVVALFNQKDIWYLGGLSPTALVHGYGDWVDETGELIDPLEKPSKETIKLELELENPDKHITKTQVFRQFQEKMKKWREKIKKSYYRVDMRGKLLVFLDAPHPDTFARLLPILSHDQPEISYKHTVSKKTELRTEHVKIVGWPATIFCTTNKTWLEDFSTRSFTITPRTTEAKLRAAVELTGRDYSFPKRFRQDEKTKARLQLVLSCLQNRLTGNNVEVLIPYSQSLSRIIPIYKERVMRDFSHILTFIRLNAILNHVNRPEITVNDEEFLLATKEDFVTVFKMFQFCEETTVTGLSQHIITVFNDLMKPLMVFNYKTLVEKSKEVLDYPLSSKTLYKYVEELEKIGWVDQQPDPEDKRRRIITVIRTEKNLLSYSLSQFHTFFTLETFKEWLKEHFKLFSQNPENSTPLFLIDGKEWNGNGVNEVFTKYYGEKSAVVGNEKRENNTETLKQPSFTKPLIETSVNRESEDKRIFSSKEISKDKERLRLNG